MAAPRTINASDFKARCLGVLDEVQATGAEVVITKRGLPVARLVPVGKGRTSLRGAWKGLARIRGDIVHVDWSDEFRSQSMKHLLDTHVAVWWLTDDRRLGKAHARVLERAEKSGVSVGLSAISLWEIAKLVDRGRIELDQAIDESLAELESHSTLTIIPISARIAVESTRLGARFPPDPVDQIIAATARCHALTLLTVDERIIESGVVSVA